MKKLSEAWMVKRCIQIPGLINKEHELTIKQGLTELYGIDTIHLDINHSKLIIHYDASKLNYQTIAKILTKMEMAPLDNWWARLKVNWYQFTDENAKENANAVPAACCNKPPGRLR